MLSEKVGRAVENSVAADNLIAKFDHPLNGQSLACPAG
ncbi:hypothetical protein SAMCFNEI73_Ch1767 [Sinorhizobium americanum]|uniref:Uncharacterized protein n=1 Tax=Sinorhizobium americanum TaxID=194963 RepID=A0A1L3LLS9_9HYPH|nr:hypothetical protein SAMCFNEI73_Ch1767 [Sinorhizobium americanum]